MFINKHKQSNIIENDKVFLNKIEELKLFIIKIDKNGVIKPKTFPLNYTVGDNY